MYGDSVNVYRDIVNAIRTAEKKKYAEGHVDGEAEGLAKGRKEGRTEVAKTMLNKGMSTEIVAEMTGLSIDELQQILNS